MKYMKNKPQMHGLEAEVLFAVSNLIEKLYKTAPNVVTPDFFAPTEIEHVYVIPTKASHLRKYFDGSIQEKLCKGIISLDYHPFSYNISNILGNYFKEEPVNRKLSKILDTKYDYILFEPANQFQQTDFYNAIQKLNWCNSQVSLDNKSKTLVVASKSYIENSGLDSNFTDESSIKVLAFSDQNLNLISKLNSEALLFFDNQPSALQILIEKTSPYVRKTLSLNKKGNSIYCSLLDGVSNTPNHGEAASQWVNLLGSYAVHSNLNLIHAVELTTASKRDLEA